MRQQQLEIGFTPLPVRAGLAQRPMSRAAWWFNQMRRVVNRALDWKPAPPPRSEQIYLALAGNRHASS